MRLFTNFGLKTKLKETNVINDDHDRYFQELYEKYCIDEDLSDVNEDYDIFDDVEYDMSDYGEEITPENTYIERINSNRFRVEFIGYDLRDFQVIGVSPIRWTRLDGWGNITLTLHNTIGGPSTVQTLYHQFRDLQDFEFTLYMLDPVGGVAQKWSIQVDTVQNIRFSGYSNRNGGNTEQELEMTLKPINCILHF